MDYIRMRHYFTAAQVDLLMERQLMSDRRKLTVVDIEDTGARSRLFIVAATIAINVMAVALLTFTSWSDWKTGAALNLVDNTLLLWYAAKRLDVMLARFFLFGLAVGFSELAADAWLVDYTTTLDYSIGGGPMIWRSPFWMPFAWEIVAVQFGYVGLWLWNRFGGWGLVGTGLLGAINIPYYEEMARRINWWEYGNCRMLSNTPYYIILGEFGIAVLLAILAKRVIHRTWVAAVVAGLAGGLGIFLCYAFAYTLIDGIIPR
jgi:hypothetical protein